MAYANFDKAIREVLKHEGGYVDHPSDPGGATNFGITIAVLAEWRGKKVTKTDVKKLTIEEAIKIYKKNYWDKLKCDDLPSGLDYAVMDFGVNSGISRSGKYLQMALGFTGKDVDGVIGKKTLEKANKSDVDDLIVKLMNMRLNFLKGLKHWPTFGRGWTRRVNEVRSFALKLAVAPVAPVPPTPDPIKEVIETVEKDLKDSGEKARASLGLYNQIVETIAETVDDAIREDLEDDVELVTTPSSVTIGVDPVKSAQTMIEEIKSDIDKVVK